MGQGTVVLPVYCLDPRHLDTTPYGNSKMSARRLRFLVRRTHATRPTHGQSVRSR